MRSSLSAFASLAILLSGKTAATAIYAPPASTTNAAGCSGALTKFQFFGVNESGAEFGSQNIPGVLGKDYTWPSPSSIDYFVGKGFNTFRVTFLMERLNPPSSGLTGPFDATYLSGLTTATHNYMRYNGAIISSNSDFSTFWTNLANQFKSNSHVIFDLQNEPNGIDATVVAASMQAAVNAIRAAGATSQLILVEGTCE
ncbi:hypothetical protein C0993_009231 [Termitomyces sp. T159_Od127]|nr:hypothetical protein C0993_009231 [Termitomyces sp. T159_Od127]